MALPHNPNTISTQPAPHLMPGAIPQHLGGSVLALPAIAEVASTSPSEVAEQDPQRLQEIATHPLLDKLPPEERAKAVHETSELYKTAKEVVAPVVTGFADHLLSIAGEDQIIFAGRDGLGAYRAAQILKQKFDYGNDDPDQLLYGYLTRKLVWNTPPDQMSRYLSEIGVHDPNERVLMADIGMYGSILNHLQMQLPHIEPHFLISRTNMVPGYASEPGRELSSLTHISGNPGVHFMEDTFSGPIPSPHQLVEEGGRLVPDTAQQGFPPAEALKREFALKAIEDYTNGLSERPDQPMNQAVNTLNDLLLQPDRFQHMMVPHTR